MTTQEELDRLNGEMENLKDFEWTSKVKVRFVPIMSMVGLDS